MEAQVTSIGSVRKPTSPYFVSLPVDFMLIGGASLVVFLVGPLFYHGPMTSGMVTVSLWLTWMGNWSHQSATNYRLYSSTRSIRQYPFTAFGVPLLILLAIAGSFRAPQMVTPYFIKITLTWILYHYTGQTIGISLLYARRAGRVPSRVERFFLVAFLYGTFLSRSLWLETSPDAAQYFGISYPRFGVPMSVSYAVAAWTYACALGFFVVLIRSCVHERRWPPIMYLLPSVTQYVWFFVVGPLPAFVEFVPFFHGLQYLTVAWATQLKERFDRGAARRSRRFVVGETVRWYLLNVAGGAALFYVLPRAVTFATGSPETFVRAVMFTALQVQHHFVDGVIWKLRSPAVSAPLMANIPQLVREAA